MTRFSQRPLKFFSSPLQNLHSRNALLLDSIFPKTLPKNEIGKFLVKLESKFLGNRNSWLYSPAPYYGPLRPILMKIKALCFFPKSIKENITMSRGTAVYSVKGIFLYSLWLCQLCPPLHGERSLSQAESPLFSRVEDKKRPYMSFAKSSNARSFCLCRRVSHFCLFSE